MRKAILAHYARIGRRGGMASTPAKREAARRNALKRWRGVERLDILPLTALRDGVWYRGRGRNSSLGLWDARAGCFWTISMGDFANPSSFPRKSERKVRLKREDYFSKQAGTFKPLVAVGH